MTFGCPVKLCNCVAAYEVDSYKDMEINELMTLMAATIRAGRASYDSA